MINYFEKYEHLSEKDPDIVIAFNRAIEKTFKEKNIDIEFIKYILTSTELKNQRKIFKDESLEYQRLSLEEFILIPASDKNLVEIIEYIFSDPKTDKEFLDRTLDYCLYRASSKGSFNVVEYLLTSSHLTRIANVDHIQSPLMSACENGHLNIVKFLLESPKLKKHSSLEPLQDYYGFSHLCNIFSSPEPLKYMFDNENDRNYLERRLDTIRYLILENYLQKDEEIEDYINKPENKIIKSIFDVQELKSELNLSIENETIKRKPKL